MGMIFKKDYNLNLDVLNKCIKDGKILNSRLGLMLKCLARSINSDCMFSERLDEHDDFFIPKNETEQILWENLRTSAKIQIRSIETNRQNGKMGGRPKKETPVVQQVPQPKEEKPIRGSFVAPTEEEFLKMAQEWDKSAGMDGFECSKNQAISFYSYYNSQGWLKANGQHITNIKSAFRQWILRKEKDDLPKLI
jgi:hypothetical protein